MLEPSTIIIAIGSAIAFFTAVANRAIAEIAWHELEEYCRLKQKDQVFDEIHDRWQTAVATTEVIQNAGMLTAILAMMSLPQPKLAESNAWLLASWIIIALAVVMSLTVWIPREVARCWGPAYLTSTWPLWQRLDRLFWPLHATTSLLRLITRRLDGQVDESTEEEALEDEILSIVTEGQHDGLLEDDVREMIAGVIELDDTDVADIMTPRSKMDAIPLDMPWSSMLQFVVRVGRTRIPVYDKNLDDVVGLLYVKDLLAVLSTDGHERPRNLSEILREVRRVPRSTRLDELLQTFLHTRIHLAIVVDEFMHVVGLVTIEDVLEEIVGEIVDETDAEEPTDIRWLTEQSAEVQGRAHVEDINDMLGTRLPISHEYDTIGGFILHRCGRIPGKGECLELSNLRITIEHATKRRIERVRMELDQKPKTVDVK